MGSSSSKFKKQLYHGDEVHALHIFQNSKGLQKKLDPNISYGERYNHDTPLHLVSRHAMKELLRLFLFELGGNPNKKNGRNESALHCLCHLRDVNSKVERALREECINMLLEWTGVTLGDGSRETLDIASQDMSGNTALHYAAQFGLESCVKLLVARDAPLFTENSSNLTPCEMAEKASQTAIAAFLESKMVFCDIDEGAERQTSPEQLERLDDYTGLRPQDLQEAKDSLIVETADMLRVPLFTAEALLRNHEWSREGLLEAWIADPRACCDKAGVAHPANLDEPTSAEHELEVSSHSALSPTEPCEICYEEIGNEGTIPMICSHNFCKDCWQNYLHTKIKEGDAHNILCPGHSCHRLVPVEAIERIVSPTMARRYLQFDIKAFVESNPRLVWCPYPGCGLAIQQDSSRHASFSSVTSRGSKQPASLTASCSSGHTFCWSCMSEPHDPATCDQYKTWLEKIAQVKKDEVQDVEKRSEIAAVSFWLINNSKKCPNCKSPIEKNEGCNHMKCSKCKHDFCWVCLEPWKKHNSMTGGFFRCTRYEVVEKVDEQHSNELNKATDNYKALQELNRFVHYFTRYDNHRHSYELEAPLLDRAKTKMSQLAHQDSSTLSKTKFVEESISVLLKSRHILQFSYIFGYYLEEGAAIKKMVFELLQTELEEKTEYLSEIIARPYLRTPKTQIMMVTRQVADKTNEFLSSIANGLLPQEKTVGAIVRPGTSFSPISLDHPSQLSDSDDSDDNASSGFCKAEGCNKMRLRHSGSVDQHHDYCSLYCLESDYHARSKRKAIRHGGQHPQIDLIQALERSRVQLLQDMDSLNTSSSDIDSGEGDQLSRRHVAPSDSDPILEHVLRLSQSAYVEEQDEDLNLAIQISLQSDREAQEMLYQARSATRRERAHSYSDSLSASSPHTPEPVAVQVHAENAVAGAAAQSAQERYQSQLQELDNAIAELLRESKPEPGPRVRRSESDRRASTEINEVPERVMADSRLRRTESERPRVRRSLRPDQIRRARRPPDFQ